MISVDDILQVTSGEVFGLRNTHYRILRNIAKHGSLSLTELGKMTSAPDYTYHPYKRWGVRSRLDGSNKYLGLIPNQYVYPIPINKKETRYALTLKGLCAILPKMKFEKIFIVKEYKKFLREFTKDENLIKWSMGFIKFEIALILFHNYIKGLNLTKFKQLKKYWEEFKKYDQRTIDVFFIYPDFLYPYDEFKKRGIGNYNEVVKEYLKLFFILDLTTTTIKWGKLRDSKLGFPDYKHDSLRKHVDMWYLFIDFILPQQKVAIELNDGIQSLAQSFNQDWWNTEQKALRKEAKNIVKNTLKK